MPAPPLFIRFFLAVLLFCLPLAVKAQTLTIVAGNGTYGYGGDGGPATQAMIKEGFGLTIDANGALFTAENGNFRVRRVSSDGIITTVAGNGTFGYSGDGGTATEARLYEPTAVATDKQGNLYIADERFVRKVSPDGIITRVAGNGYNPSADEGVAATQTGLARPYGLATDKSGNLYIAELDGQRIRKVSPDGIITTVAGNSRTAIVSQVRVGTYSGDGGPAVQAGISSPRGITVDSQGNLYIADQGNHRVRKVTPDGIITTVAGDGTEGYGGDGGPATAAKLAIPQSVAVDGSGNLYIADYSNSRIRKVSPDGIITTVAGNGSTTFTQEGPATASAVPNPRAVVLDSTDNLYIATSGRILKVNLVSMYTLKPGNWSESATWSAGRVPQPADTLKLNHVVSLPGGYSAPLQRLIYGPAGGLRLGTDSQLKLGGN